MNEVVSRSSFALITSEFDDFLLASVGDEGNGMTLSVLSAMARLDIDPWREAARLSALSKEKAIEALTPIIARLPCGQWAPADILGIASRLVAILPQREGAAVIVKKKGFPTIFLVLSLIFSTATWFLVGVHHQSPSSNGRAPTDISRSDRGP